MTGPMTGTRRLPGPSLSPATTPPDPGLVDAIASRTSARTCRARLAWALALTIGAGACGWRNNSSSVGQKAIPVSSLPPEQRAARVPGQTRYVLQAGDQVDVKFFYNPELNENQSIRPDGAISLQLVGDVAAAGFTPADLTERLRARYEPLLRRPDVVVIVRKHGTSRVYVAGEVLNPGPIALEGRPLTALEAIMAVGGFRPSAARSSVVVLRNDGTAEPTFIKLDLQAYLEQVANEDLALHPFDIVYVPQTEIGEVAQFFDLYFNKIVPLYKNMGFTFNYGLGSFGYPR